MCSFFFKVTSWNKGVYNVLKKNLNAKISISFIKRTWFYTFLRSAFQALNNTGNRYIKWIFYKKFLCVQMGDCWRRQPHLTMHGIFKLWIRNVIVRGARCFTIWKLVTFIIFSYLSDSQKNFGVISDQKKISQFFPLKISWPTQHHTVINVNLDSIYKGKKS